VKVPYYSQPLELVEMNYLPLEECFITTFASKTQTIACWGSYTTLEMLWNYTTKGQVTY